MHTQDWAYMIHQEYCLNVNSRGIACIPSDLRLILISTEFRFAEIRAEISEQNGVEVREFIAPSGLLVQGTQADYSVLLTLQELHPYNRFLAMVVDYSVMNVDLSTP